MAGSRKKTRASRRLGSSFQKQQATSAKTPRRRMAAAWARVGALEAGFTVEPWPTMRSAELFLACMGSAENVERPTPNVQSRIKDSNRQVPSALTFGRWAFGVGRFLLNR